MKRQPVLLGKGKMHKFAVDDTFKVSADVTDMSILGKFGVIIALPTSEFRPNFLRGRFRKFYEVRLDGESQSRHIEDTQMDVV